MATNPALWVGYPRSYTIGRIRDIQFVTLHTTEGSTGPTAAEDGAAYDKRRTDGTSCHAFADSAGPPLQEVPIGDRAHCALFRGNEIGVHIEMCARAAFTRERWLQPDLVATMQSAAAFAAYVCLEAGLDYRRRLTVAETRLAYYGAPGSRPTGINEHFTCTQAFPEDGGSHTNVGPGFPWDVFMDMVATAAGDKPTPPQEEDDMSTKGWIAQREGSGIAVIRDCPWCLTATWENVVTATAVAGWAAAGYPGPFGVDIPFDQFAQPRGAHMAKHPGLFASSGGGGGSVTAVVGPMVGTVELHPAP